MKRKKDDIFLLRVVTFSPLHIVKRAVSTMFFLSKTSGKNHRHRFEEHVRFEVVVPSGFVKRCAVHNILQRSNIDATSYETHKFLRVV